MEEINLNLEDIEKKMISYKKQLSLQEQIKNNFKNNDDIEVIFRLLDNNNEKIQKYCDELINIDKSIRKLVKENKQNYKQKEEILNSNEFIFYHKRLKEVKTIIDNLDDFLKRNNIQVD